MRPPRVSLRRPIRPSRIVAIIVRTAAKPAGDSAGIADRIKPSFPPGMSAIPTPMSKRPADAVVGNRQLSACVLGLPYDRLWVDG